MDSCVCLCLFREPAVVFLPAPVPLHFEIDQHAFREYIAEWYSGFYDWLRNKEGTLIGIRIKGIPTDSLLLDSLHRLPYVIFDYGERSFAMYIGSKRDIDECQVTCADFGQSFVYVSENQSFAISFDVGSLTQSDVDTLRAYTFKEG